MKMKCLIVMWLNPLCANAQVLPLALSQFNNTVGSNRYFALVLLCGHVFFYCGRKTQTI